MQRISKFRDRVEMLTPPLPWDRPHRRTGEGPQVVLLHGLWRGWRAMEPLARALADAGFQTLNLPYPSARLPLPTLVSQVRAEVARFAGSGPVHFITHSLGGILVRSLMAEADLPWQTGRVVMLAPPNCGSEIVDWAAKHRLVRQFLGPAGCALGSDGVPAALPPLPPGAEVAVIMGRKPAIPFFKGLLENDNDGIVSASRGKIDGLCGFTVIDADHTFIQMHPEAVRLSVAFLKSGEWLGTPEKQS